MKTLIVVLMLLSLGLGTAMLLEHSRATQAVKAAQDGLLSVSNSWEQTKLKLDEAQKVATALETTLNARTEALGATSNDLAKANAGLAKTSTDLAKTQADFEAAQAEVKKQQAQIAQLENQRDDLTKKMDELTNSISTLEVKIADTQKKLAASDGDRNFLFKELQRLQGEKATLMAQFNNLAALRAQVAKLKEEAAINQRLAWMQMGVYNLRDKKGAERLLATTPPLAPPDNRLELELRQNGHGKAGSETTNAPGRPMTENQSLLDSHGRVLRDLRVSVTDRCNFRCLYCLPETEAAANFYRHPPASAAGTEAIARQWTPRSHLLTFEEIERAVRIAVGLGIQKVRLTGGEPLLRQQLEKLVARLAVIPGITDLAMTTNGFLFGQKGRALRDAGLKRISFSLDSLTRDNFKKMTGRDGLDEVLSGIAQARELGLDPVKVNAVIIRHLNDHEVEALAEFGHDQNLSMRFIEFMPLDSARAWQRELVVPGREILQRLQTRFQLQPVQSQNRSETARRWTFPDGRGEIGIIAPVSEPFCGHCNRLRLTADGNLRTCLFSVTEHDLRTRLRAGATDEELRRFFQAVVWQKEARHHIGEPDFVTPNRSMSCIGG